jgi:hypothetical protein
MPRLLLTLNGSNRKSKQRRAEDLDDLIDIAVDATKESNFVPTKESVQCGNDGFVFMYAGDIYGDCL